MASGTLIAMEACSTAHYWARTIENLGFKVCLIPPQHVKAFVKHHKNDANDALAICEAANRPLFRSKICINKTSVFSIMSGSH